MDDQVAAWIAPVWCGDVCEFRDGSLFVALLQRAGVETEIGAVSGGPLAVLVRVLATVQSLGGDVCDIRARDVANGDAHAVVALLKAMHAVVAENACDECDDPPAADVVAERDPVVDERAAVARAERARAVVEDELEHVQADYARAAADVARLRECNAAAEDALRLAQQERSEALEDAAEARVQADRWHARVTALGDEIAEVQRERRKQRDDAAACTRLAGELQAARLRETVLQRRVSGLEGQTAALRSMLAGDGDDFASADAPGGADAEAACGDGDALVAQVRDALRDAARERAWRASLLRRVQVAVLVSLALLVLSEALP